MEIKLCIILKRRFPEQLETYNYKKIELEQGPEESKYMQEMAQLAGKVTSTT